MRLLVAVLTTVLALGGLAAVPRTAEADTAATSVTVFLRPPDRAALDRLATTQGLTRAERVAAVEQLVPSATVHARVAERLAAQGFTVTGQTSWSITATGTAARTASLFGTRPRASRTATPARQAAATGPLPRVPEALADDVTAAFPTASGAPAFRHHTTSSLTGTDLRKAYAPATVAPSSGTHDGALTVATIQLADFYSASSSHANTAAADLAAYARRHGIADPVAAKRYRAVEVDGGPRYEDDLFGGDIEVSLDQQAILSTAPSARQQAYFAPNTDAGYNDAFAAVYDDVVGSKHATAANPSIAALSVSWGQCESVTGSANITVLEPILESLLAAGVTVFASSGDYGIYDCGMEAAADVDYPASSPSVVGVGGTRLSAASSAPNTGANWTESGWNCTDATSCAGDFGSGGGGGGLSRFAVPDYQRAGIDDAPFAGRTHRLVPDIGADADPDTGFTVYCSDPQVGGDVVEGGTSLASPLSAAGLVNALGDAGRRSGVGAIHGALYTAYAATRAEPATDRTRAFRDVTSGSNGASADRRGNPSVTARRGYDTVSGLGAPLWGALTRYLLDGHRPTLTASMSQPHVTSSAWQRVRAAWTVGRGADPLLLGHTSVTIARDGVAAPVYRSTAYPTSRSRTFTGAPGATYLLTVTGRDIGGRSVTRHATATVPVDDSKYARSHGWRRVSGRADVGGNHLLSTRKGAALTATGTGRTYALSFYRGPHGGRVGIFLGGKRVKTLDLHASTYRRATTTVYRSTHRARRSLTIRSLAKGRAVAVDALRVGW